MKKILIFITLAFLLTTSYYVLSTTIIQAQTLDANKAFQDYQFQLSSYNQAYSEFEDARDFYKKTPTLQQKEEARKKTLALVKSRDQLIVVYLTAIRTGLLATNGLSSDEKNSIFAKVDPEVSWYQSHSTSYLDNDDLETLFKKSDESKIHYNSPTKPIIYESLFDISLSDEIELKNNHIEVYSDLKDYLNNQVTAGKLTLDPFSRWISQIDAVLQTLSQNEDSSKVKIQQVYAQNNNNSTSTYNSSVQTLTSSQSLLNQLNNYLSEMLTSIQNMSQ